MSFWVYPRVCGGTASEVAQVLRVEGLSPRVRGNRHVATVARSCHGSIPACAGEPGSTISPDLQQRVYPRVCGGTAAKDASGAAQPTRVYPRVCGGTSSISGEPQSEVAHSPRVEGLRTHAADFGSIPACAGEPRNRTISPDELDFRVYPRVCGGTASRKERHLPIGSIPACAGEPRFRPPQWWDSFLRGLSPRVRGNPCRPLALSYHARSIPACAGEPSARFSSAASIRVYPRVCGGTPSISSSSNPTTGLSPRVRGNLTGHLLPSILLGSIPACAGEPFSPTDFVQIKGVYPRVCGGTRGRAKGSDSGVGLSPRVRGNPSSQFLKKLWIGSIPACAGEPYHRHPATSQERVYPRVCGGTSTMHTLVALAHGSIPACAGEPLADKILILIEL